MEEDKRCPVCNSYIANQRIPLELKSISYFKINCFRCGEFVISEIVIDTILDTSGKKQKTRISHWISNRQFGDIPIINMQNIPTLGNLKELTVFEKGDRLLFFMAENYAIFYGKSIKNPATMIHEIQDLNYSQFKSNKNKKILRVLAYADILLAHELEYLLREYLATLEYIKPLHSDFSAFTITPSGWLHLEKLRYANIESNTIFIAMRFDKTLLKFCDNYFIPGIEAAGFDAKRVDREHHTNTIDDEIIALIRRSKLVIADFTENSYGVYFESGFARGLNHPIIYTCNKDYFEDKNKKPHFDVEHYPFILWENDKGPELQKAIQLRIESLVGRGINLEKKGN